MSDPLRPAFNLYGILFVVAASIAYFIQTHYFLEADVIYLIHASEKLLQGGSYTTDFFETNPPMILYLYAPIVWLKNIFNVDLVTAARTYVVALAFISYCLCAFLLRRYQFSRGVYCLLIATLLFTYLFLPASQFGQREHLMVMLTMPYWCLAAMILVRKLVNRNIRLLVGVIAGIGFALKPFFYIPFVLVEGYLFYQSKNIFSFVRVEVISVVLVAVAYLASIFYFQPDYLATILPLVNKYYFVGAKEPLIALVAQPLALFCAAILLISPFAIRELQMGSIAKVFAIVMAGFFLAYLLPGSAWFYHLLPALCIACLLCVLMCVEANNDYFRVMVLTVLMALPMYYCYECFKLGRQGNDVAMNDLISSIKSKKPAAKIYCLPRHHACSVLSAYAGASYASRFPSQWLLRGMVKSPMTARVKQDKSDWLSLLVEDIIQAEPDYMIIDNSIPLAGLTQHNDYIEYFSDSSEFKKAWQSYRFIKRAGPYAVYQRHHSTDALSTQRRVTRV